MVNMRTCSAFFFCVAQLCKLDIKIVAHSVVIYSVVAYNTMFFFVFFGLVVRE